MSRCWEIILLGDLRQYAENTGYQDQAEQYYEYDTNVPNHKQVSVGDIVLLRDKESAFAISKIESIETENAVKEHLRCSKCTKTGIKTRRTKVHMKCRGQTRQTPSHPPTESSIATSS